MVSATGPPFKRKTPSNYPELRDIWKKMYDELIETHPKSRALQIIGERHHVSRQCAMWHLFPDYKLKQKKYPSKKWDYEKGDPEIYKKRIDYKARYMAARRHIDVLIRESYQKAAPLEEMTVEELVEGIHEASGIFFRPEVIAGLVKKLQAKNGCPLLEEVPGCDPPRYRFINRPQ